VPGPKGHQLPSCVLKGLRHFKLYVHPPDTFRSFAPLGDCTCEKSGVLYVPEATKKATSRTLNKQFIRPFHAISQLAKLLIKMAQSIFISFVASVRFFGPNFRCPQTNQQASEKLIKVFCQYNILIMRKLTKVSENAPRGKRVFLFAGDYISSRY